MNENSFLSKVLKGLKWFYHSYIWLFVLFIIVDFVTKQLVVRNMTPGDSITLIPSWDSSKPFLAITYSVNTNAAFSFGVGDEAANRIFYSIIAFLGLGVIIGIYSWKFKQLNGIFKACLMLMAVGALGNLIDRLFYSASFLHSSFNGVVDWIDFAVIWPFIFNIADSCVVVGTLILVVYLIVDEVKTVRAARAKEVKENGGKVLSVEEQMRLEDEKSKEQISTKEVEDSGADAEIDEEQDMQDVDPS